MTREEARRRAVEAAVKAVWGDCWNELDDDTQASALADGHAHIAAYECAMADAGWRMVRDVGDRGESRHFGRGWNACRRAMLAEDDAGG